MLFNLFSKPVDVPMAPDMLIHDYELISRLFGQEEAKKSLLNVVPPANPTVDEVMRDAQALESMMMGHGWLVYEKAVWLKLLTALRLSLAAKTIEEREAARNQVLSCLACLHLPYEMRFASDNIKKMRELEKSRQEAGV